MSPRRLVLSSLLLFAALSAPLSGAIVWTEGAPGISTITIDKPSFADPNLVNDPITPLVIIARGDDRGLFNLVSELSHTQDLSPAGTEWAFSGLNGNPAGISATDFATLNFTDWRNSLGARGQLQGNIVNRPGVLHLIDEDIYLEITFTEWGGASSGGAFRYARTAGPVPEPSGLTLLGLAVIPLLLRSRPS